MNPLHPETPPDKRTPIPVARPASSQPASPPPVVVAQPTVPSDDHWWAPAPITRLQALGDILLVAVVLVVPQAAAMLIGRSIHTAPEPVPAGRMLAANSMVWAAVAGVAIYLIHRTGQPLSSIGIRRENAFAAVGAAITSTLAIYAAVLVTALTAAVLTHASRQTMTAPVRQIEELLGPPSWLAIFGIAATAGVFEEIVFRGFLLTRLRVIVGSWGWAVAIGAVLFAVPHVWEGLWAVVLIVPVAVVLSITFIARRGLAAPILAHFLFNFVQLSGPSRDAELAAVAAGHRYGRGMTGFREGARDEGRGGGTEDAGVFWYNSKKSSGMLPQRRGCIAPGMNLPADRWPTRRTGTSGPSQPWRTRRRRGSVCRRRPGRIGGPWLR